MARQLMPVGNDAPRCSDFARALGVLPLGSGLRLDRVVLVSVPMPWPKPAVSHAWIVAANAGIARSPVPTRLFAAEPTPQTDGSEGGIVVEVFERRTSPAVPMVYRWKVASPDVVTALVTAISSAAPGEIGRFALPGAPLPGSTLPGSTLLEASALSRPTFLVCTQGSHDTCCGVDGVALADAIERTRPAFVVRRISHTGGHRFAPTFLALPEGRMWAYADIGLVERIASSTVTADDLLARSRGWWGAKVGPAQVAEAVVRAEVGAESSGEISIEVGEAGGDGMPYGCVVTREGRQWHVDVHVSRTVPSIACESRGGLPAKQDREFGWSVRTASTTGAP